MLGREGETVVWVDELGLISETHSTSPLSTFAEPKSNTCCWAVETLQGPLRKNRCLDSH